MRRRSLSIVATALLTSRSHGDMAVGPQENSSVRNSTTGRAHFVEKRHETAMRNPDNDLASLTEETAERIYIISPSLPLVVALSSSQLLGWSVC
jgi:hypothetical protein